MVDTWIDRDTEPYEDQKWALNHCIKKLKGILASTSMILCLVWSGRWVNAVQKEKKCEVLAEPVSSTDAETDIPSYCIFFAQQSKIT